MVKTTKISVGRRKFVCTPKGKHSRKHKRSHRRKK